jgi:SAM-dependent methyltransferase
MDQDRERLRTTFEEDAQRYDRARPGYPAALVDDLVALAQLRPGDRVLEIGPGTGQLTTSLAERGLCVLGVELGPTLAEVARANTARDEGVSIVTGSFETWDPGDDRFDAVVAATSWHWLDPASRDERAAHALRPGGALVVVTTDHPLPPGGDPFFADIQDVYVEIGEGLPDGAPTSPDEIGDRAAEIAASGYFAPPEVRRYLHEITYTATTYIDVLETYSGHRAMTHAQRERLYTAIRERVRARADGLIRKHYLNILHVARRVDGV